MPGYFKSAISAFLLTLTIILSLGMPSRSVYAGIPTTIVADVGPDLNDTIMEIVNGIAFIGKKIVIKAVRKTLIDFVQTGRLGGGSLVIRNFKEELLRAADDAAAGFINDVAKTDICSPFEISARVLLSEHLDLPSEEGIPRARCSLSEAIDIQRGALEDFYDDFRNGGWDAWVVHNRPENTLIGFWVLADDESIYRTGTEVRGASLNAETNRGYVGVEICTRFFENTTRCQDKKIVTPGTLVADQVEEYFGSDLENFIAADTWKEVIIGLTDVLFLKLLGDAYGGLSDEPDFGGDDEDPSGGTGGEGDRCESETECNSSLVCRPLPHASTQEKFCQARIAEGEVCRTSASSGGDSGTTIGECEQGLQCVPSIDSAEVYTCQGSPGDRQLHERCNNRDTINVPLSEQCDRSQGLVCTTLRDDWGCGTSSSNPFSCVPNRIVGAGGGTISVCLKKPGESCTTSGDTTETFRPTCSTLRCAGVPAVCQP